MANITLLRRSRTDSSSIIFNEDTSFYGIVSDAGLLCEESDELASLLSSGSWRRPLKEETDSFDFDPEAGPELILPTVDSQLIISVLNKGKASSTVVRTIKNDLEKLEEWADNVSESVEDSFDFPQEGFEYFAASLQENSPVSHELWACDNDGDLFSFEDSKFVPSSETIETLDRPSIFPIDEETAEDLAKWLRKEEPSPLDLYYLDPEESALFDEALEEIDFTSIDDEADILLSSGEYWYDDVDKYVRQTHQERDWHGRYSGPQHESSKKVFFPRARLEEEKEINLDPLKVVSLDVAKNTEAALEPGGDNTLYVAIVDSVDRTAVMDIIAIVTDPETGRPNSWIRRGGQWFQDDNYLRQIQSVTPPTTVILDTENKENIENIISQVDATDKKRNVSAAEASLIAASLSQNADKYDQDARDSIIASAISLNITEVIPAGWERSSLSPLYTSYGDVLTAGGVPGIADTPQDFANTARLKNYWAFGKGTAKWRPGTKGDLTRLHRHLAKYVGPERAWGLAQNIHKMHFGMTNYKRDN